MHHELPKTPVNTRNPADLAADADEAFELRGLQAPYRLRRGADLALDSHSSAARAPARTMRTREKRAAIGVSSNYFRLL